MSAAEQRQLFDDDGYPVGFFAWLDKNWRIWKEFELRALKMWRSGRSRYSARTIVEVIRWNTDLRDKDVTFKINDKHTPWMARYFLDIHPECKGFFELRGEDGANR